MWYRVFGGNSRMPAPAAILEYLAGLGTPVSGEFTTDASDWYRSDLFVDGVELQLERYLAEEEGIRAELNSWAAWLETRADVPEHLGLMERMIQTNQLFTLRSSEGSARADEVCAALCRFLAETTAGVYQIDERGIFTADGGLLITE